MLECIDNGNNNPFTLSQFYAVPGRDGEAIAWLETARDEKIPWYPWLVTWFPRTRALHDDPRAQRMAEELGIPLPSA